jgi:hypothetical protein
LRFKATKKITKARGSINEKTKER